MAGASRARFPQQAFLIGNINQVAMVLFYMDQISIFHLELLYKTPGGVLELPRLPTKEAVFDTFPHQRLSKKKNLVFLDSL